MDVGLFVEGIICILGGFMIIWIAPQKAYKNKDTKLYKTVKVKYFFRFLFTDHYSFLDKFDYLKNEKKKTKVVRIHCFIFQFIGYILTMSALIVFIICYSIGIEEIKWLCLAIPFADLLASAIFIGIMNP